MTRHSSNSKSSATFNRRPLLLCREKSIKRAISFLVISWLLLVAQILRLHSRDGLLLSTAVTPIDQAEWSRRQKRRSSQTNGETKNSSTLQPFIPDALQPITYDLCCEVKGHPSTGSPTNNLDCRGTCFTDRACTDLSYPFDTLGEKQKHMLRDLDDEERIRLKQRCVEKPELTLPNVTWCSSNETRYNSTEIALGMYGHVPQPGCSLVTEGGGSGPWQHLYIIPKAKLAFCGIPKVGITQWIQFVRFIAGAKDYPAFPHKKQDKDFFRFDKLNPSLQQEIWSSKEWTFAAFLRDPTERLLSAYLDKITDTKIQKEIQSALGMKVTKLGFKFRDFVERLDLEFNKTGCTDGNVGNLNSMTGLNWCSDPHWRPQIMSCGLYSNLDRFQFVGDINNSSQQTQDLLQRVGLWELYGKRFINGGIGFDNDIEFSPCMVRSHHWNYTEHVGFQQIGVDTAYSHKKNSQKEFKKYYTLDLLDLVNKKLYADDYKLYDLVHKRKITNGKQLAMELSGTGC